MGDNCTEQQNAAELTFAARDEKEQILKILNCLVHFHRAAKKRSTKNKKKKKKKKKKSKSKNKKNKKSKQRHDEEEEKYALNDPTNKTELLEDIRNMGNCTMHAPGHIEAVIAAFIKKWKDKGETPVMEWFETYYGGDKKGNWSQAAAGPHTPNTNNTIEGGNLGVKKAIHHEMRTMVQTLEKMLKYTYKLSHQLRCVLRLTCAFVCPVRANQSSTPHRHFTSFTTWERTKTEIKHAKWADAQELVKQKRFEKFAARPPSRADGIFILDTANFKKAAAQKSVWEQNLKPKIKKFIGIVDARDHG